MDRFARKVRIGRLWSPKFHLLLGVIALGSARAAEAQSTSELRGRVVDITTNQPVADVIVRLPALRRYTLTDREGLFRLGAVPRGMQTLEIVHLAYHERTVQIDIHPDSTAYEISIEPHAIRLDSIVVRDWRRVGALMNSAARRHAMRMSGTTGDPVFWWSWDREQIVASGQKDAFNFLRKGPPKISVRKCTGLAYAGIDQLCIGVPYDGRYGGGGVADLMFGSAAEHRPGSRMSRRPATSVALPVLIDDRPVRLEDLAQYDMTSIYRVEAFGYRGERGIRMYTEGYLHMVAAGRITLRGESFDFILTRPDSLLPEVRRDR